MEEVIIKEYYITINKSCFIYAMMCINDTIINVMLLEGPSLPIFVTEDNRLKIRAPLLIEFNFL